MPIELEQSASQPAAVPKTQRSSRMVPVIALVMGLALWFSGAERYRGLLVSLFMFAGLCVGGLMLVRGLQGWQKATWAVLSVIWVCWMAASLATFGVDWQRSLFAAAFAIGLWLALPIMVVIPAIVWVLGKIAGRNARGR